MPTVIPITLYASAPPINRGTVTQADKTIHCKSIQTAIAWGSAPGTAVVNYVGLLAPVSSGASVRIECGGHIFYGVCKQDNLKDGSDGRERVLDFTDNREFLDWDQVYGAFNKPDVRMVNGVRLKRYWHIYPADWLARRKTYTNTPLRARDILDALFGSSTVLSPWYRFYHADQFLPVYDIDCMNGRDLRSVVQEITEKQGLVMGLNVNTQFFVPINNVPWRLYWVRKGEGILPNFPSNADDRRSGLALSGNASRVIVLGDENLYQVMDIPLLQDWAPAWERFVVFEEFADDIFKRGSDPGTNIRFNATPGDPEQYIGRQLANARANTITLTQYIALRNTVRLGAEPVNDGNRFADFRKFSNRSRMDMPCALYIKQLLFRAFAPDLVSFINAYDQEVLLDDAQLADRLLARVSHNPLTGAMSFFPDETVEGNGYAIVKGYQVGSDLFRSLRPEQFRLDMFADTRAVWEHTQFQLDDSGEGNRFLIFDEPVVVSNNLMTDVDGHKVINANFTLQVPPARAALVFACERFYFPSGTVGRDMIENVAGLHGEFVVAAGAVTELPFANGEFSSEKAFNIADPLLTRQWYYAGGGYTVKGSNGTLLTAVIDRVQVNFGPDGVLEAVDFTNERGHSAFQPERELDRATQLDPLFPGQADLDQEATYAKLLAAGFKQNQKFQKSLSDYLNGTAMLNTDQPVERVFATPPFLNNLPAGTPLRRAAMVPGTPNTKTFVVPPGTGLPAADYTLFAGVTVRHNERTDKAITVQTTGVALARVMGPVSENDGVNLADLNTKDYLIKGGSGAAVGIAQGKITQADVDAGHGIKLIPVQLGAGGGSALNWEGEWVATRDYAKGALIIRGSQNLSSALWNDAGTLLIDGTKAGLYVALQSVPAGIPPGGPDEPNSTAYWETVGRFATHIFAVKDKNLPTSGKVTIVAVDKGGTVQITAAVGRTATLTAGSADSLMSLAGSGGIAGGTAGVFLNTADCHATPKGGVPTGYVVQIRPVHDCESTDAPGSLWIRLVSCSERIQLS